MNDEAKSKPDSLPVAKVQPSRSWAWVWLVPIFAFMFAGFLFFTHVVEKGPVLTIQFPQGHGVKPDDALRCRGIQIGFVESAVLDEDLEGVTVKVRLEHSAKSVGRAGSRFWIVRPRVDLTGVSGLETVAGPRYIAVLPGDGAKQREFVGLEQAPVVSMVEPDGLEVTLYAEQRGSVVPGAPILYRQIPVGNVLSVGLASDASGVEIRAYIRPMYRRIVCEKTVFWNVSGADLKVGWSGLRVELDSLQSFLDGGVALSTPDPSGNAVSNGHRFGLHAQPEDEWLEWRPALVVGSKELPDGASPPVLLRATSLRTGGRVWTSTTQIKGWLLKTDEGLVGPAEMLQPVDPEVHEIKAELELAGERHELAQPVIWSGDGLAIAKVDVKGPVWPRDHIRALEESEDCLVFTDRATAAIPLDAGRLVRDGESWQVDQIVSFGRNFHGAAVVARKDGKLVGLLLVQDGRGKVVSVIPDALPVEASE